MSVSQLDCKCVGVDWTQQARWRHLLLCPATPIPCPFAKDFGGCTGTLQPRETSYGAVGMALRRHFETTCTHKIACVCGCNEVMEMRLITAHLSKMRFKLDVAGMMHYRISEMEASGAFSGIDPKSACEFKMVADVGCSWGEAIERSMPKMTADKMVKFFPHRSVCSYLFALTHALGVHAQIPSLLLGQGCDLEHPQRFHSLRLR